MRRRTLALVALPVLLAATSCGLGDRQARADRIIAAVEQVEGAGSWSGTLQVEVTPVQSERAPAPGPPRITPAQSDRVPVRGDIRRRRAAVGVPETPIIIFDGSIVLHRRVSAREGDTVAVATSGAPVEMDTPMVSRPSTGLATAAARTNLVVLSEQVRPPTTSARPWIKLDYERLDRESDDRTAGSYTIDPNVVLRLLRGALAGSVEATSGPSGGDTRYRFNLSREKAERGLDNEARVTIEKMFAANAVEKDIARGEATLARDGALRRLVVTLRQTLDDGTRADLVVTIDVVDIGADTPISLPQPGDIAVVSTLDALVRASVVS